jgi:transcriptional regulator with XRE-family HTH domain
MNLGSIIKKEIKKQGKTQKKVAKIVGISDNAMSQICINATFPHKDTLEKICKHLNIKINFFIESGFLIEPKEFQVVNIFKDIHDSVMPLNVKHCLNNLGYKLIKPTK